MSALPGIIVLMIGVGLLAAPWWSATLPASDYPIAIVLGVIFAGMGAYVCVPERFGRLRTAVFALAMGAFGLVCGALAVAPLAANADGSYSVAGIPGFVAAEPLPWWARIVAGFFAIICLSTAGLGLWSVVRQVFFGERPDA
jgi:hypothetical protein